MTEVIFSILIFVILFCFLTVRNHKYLLSLKNKIDFSIPVSGSAGL